jgi:hypothetical protein
MADQADARARADGLLRSAISQLSDRRWLGIFLLFVIFLGGTNAILALAKPAAGAGPGLVFAAAGVVRAVALISISVAALRIAMDSPRRPWMPDGAFFLYFLLSMLSLAASALGAVLGTGLPAMQRLFVIELAAIVAVAPFAVWILATAVERPLAWSPMRHMRGFGVWLPSYLLWSLVLVLPLAWLHGFFSLRLIESAGRTGFWPIAAADALVSTLLVLLILSLRLAAYRSVARY